LEFSTVFFYIFLLRHSRNIITFRCVYWAGDEIELHTFNRHQGRRASFGLLTEDGRALFPHSTGRRRTPGTCGQLTSNPHERDKPMDKETAIRDVPAMRRSASHTINPHDGERDYLRPEEANRLIEAAGRVGRQPLRDKVLVRLIYRHGLRCSEATGARWADLDLDPGSSAKTFHVRRLKGSDDSVHTLDRDEVSGLRKLKADSAGSIYVFTSERGGPLSPDMVARIVARAGVTAGLGLHVHPHMLRHSAGHMLANQGTDTRLIQDFLGHRNIQNTVRYTKLAPARLAAVRVR
jgi:type 1 fimbriae regulatory protein FimB